MPEPPCLSPGEESIATPIATGGVAEQYRRNRVPQAFALVGTY
ncbi:hypothetical protein SS05631_c26470 [Sinorhizobium sp. CCBAU 05631]|nr:hypothetical protein SS05631_c26470 [Sinorhizobium sp. CCBAU 05631]